jgi:alpha-mannosidase
MHDDRVQTESRIRRIFDERVQPAQYADWVGLELESWTAPDEPVPVHVARSATFRPFQVGTAWGAPWSTVWFRATGTVPAEWAGRRVEAVIDLGFGGSAPGFQAEALGYDTDGMPLKGIAPNNQYLPVTAAAGEPVGFWIEAAANPNVLGGGFVPTGLGDKATAGQQPLYVFRRADLAVVDVDVMALRYDAQVLRELMAELPVTDPRRHEILRALERACDALDTHDRATVAASAAAARTVLAEVLSRPAPASAHTVYGAGHAHIDSAWLWPIRETRRKTARTFASVTALAAEYPELVFACSSAQQYAWLKEDHPEVYQRIRDAVSAGNWAPVGGMWVEADGNMPGGEALARQLAHGKRFFAEEFGVECRGVWLPDSFGYTAAYPQLARLAGMDWFLTQKISWNQTNTFPHHTFWWEGIDGTRIFTHFPPADTYNGTFAAAELAHAVARFAEKGAAGISLLPFGHGDGGGGPTREMLERARRLASLEGSPKVRIAAPDAFFDAARAEYPDAPVWSGELYLELHRGTYTSQARTKAGNRRSESLLREAELWATAAAVRVGAPYPYQQLDRLWKTVLLHQFHDILPGSSIAWVHREAEATHQRVQAELDAIIADAARALAGGGSSTTPWVLNTSPLPRTEVLDVVDGEPALVRVPPSGAARVDERSEDVAEVRVTDRDDGVVVDNGLVRVHVDGDGLLASVRDLTAGREVIAPGSRANLLRLHPDLPNMWDAWDVDRHYRRRVVEWTQLKELAVLERGPLRATLRIHRIHGESSVVQTLRVCAGSPAVTITNEVDWRERETLLKVAFPLDVHAGYSSAEIQFGHVQRPTHVNTSWDAARFELCGHRWVHVAEASYGIAISNDSTYGFDVTRDTRERGGTTTTVSLSLLRAPRSPDPDADQGSHTIGYSLVPGVGVDGAVAAGYAANLPLRVVPGGLGTPPRSLVWTEGGAATVESVKLADDQSGDVVVRLYESCGGATTSRLLADFPITAAVFCDLLERPLPDGTIGIAQDREIALRLRAFQIVTVRLGRSG